MADYDERYLAGVAYFNDCDFFEAHDIWEELWADYSGPSRKFYQGLIQTAVALHHFGNGNLRGARKLLVSSAEYLSPYAPHHEGVNVDKLLADMQACFADALTNDDAEIEPDLIPEIHLEEAE